MAKTAQERLTATKSVICPFCNKEFDYILCASITIPGDKSKKRKVLDKTLFYPKCPHCGERIKLKPHCIYRNETKKELFIVTDDPNTELENMMKTGDILFGTLHSDDDIIQFMMGRYKRRVVYDVDTFREKILLSDYNYDDRIIELMKVPLSKMLENETHMPVYRIFLEGSTGNDLEFTAIMGSGAPFEYITVKTAGSIYFDYKRKYMDQLDRPEADAYILTDQKWAKESGLLKNDDAGFLSGT